MIPDKKIKLHADNLKSNNAAIKANKRNFSENEEKLNKMKKHSDKIIRLNQGYFREWGDTETDSGTI